MPDSKPGRRGDNIEVRYHLNVGVRSVKRAYLLTYLLGGAIDHRMDIPLKEAFETITPDGVERAETDGAVSVDIMKELEQPILPEQRALMLVQQGDGLLLKHPAQQIIDVLKMIIEMLPADAAELGYVMDGYP